MRTRAKQKESEQNLEPLMKPSQKKGGKQWKVGFFPSLTYTLDVLTGSYSTTVVSTNSGLIVGH